MPYRFMTFADNTMARVWRGVRPLRIKVFASMLR
jgi:hypothetical protein